MINRAGALPRPLLVCRRKPTLEKTQNLKRLQATEQMSRFAGLAASPNDDDWLPEAKSREKSAKPARGKEALGVYLSGHPLGAWRRLLKNPENLARGRREADRLEEALNLNQPLALACYLKEDLRRFREHPGKAAAAVLIILINRNSGWSRFRKDKTGWVSNPYPFNQNQNSPDNRRPQAALENPLSLPASRAGCARRLNRRSPTQNENSKLPLRCQIIGKVIHLDG
jgi:hypothetical protein